MGSLGKRVYMGCEYSTIGDLFKYMEGHVWQPMQEKAAKYLIRCIASGIQHLHGLDIGHGDIKPENVLLFSSNTEAMAGAQEVTDFVPKICDFSTSQMRKEHDPPGQIIHNGRTCTINYAAPESGYEVKCPPYDIMKADVYSIGCTLLAILLGSPPFEPQSSLNYNMECNRLKNDNNYVKNMVEGYNCSWPLKYLLIQTLVSDPSFRITLIKFIEHFWFSSD